MSLDPVVDIQVSVTSPSVTRAGFGIPLVLTYHTKDAARVLEFTDASDMLVAGGGPFASSDMAYILASKCFAQSPRPTKVLVGRRVNPTIRTVDLTPLSGTINGETYPLNLTAYSVTISRDGTTETFTYTSLASATVAGITAGLVALINAGTVNVLATDNTTYLTIEPAATPGGAAAAGTPFELVYSKSLYSSEDKTPVAAGGSLADEIAAIRNVDDTWYGLVGDWWGKTEIEDAADAIETLSKVHAYASADDDIYDALVTTDPSSVLQAKALDRTTGFHHSKPEEGIAAAILGRILPADPGSLTWAYQNLAGITVQEYTPAQITAMVGKNASYYTDLGGTNVTREGKAASGEFMDIIRFVDWVEVRIQENIVAQLVASDKIPFTDPGTAVVEAEVWAVINEGIAAGGFAADPEPSVSVPLVANVSAIDKGNRYLPDVKFNATLAGAIHKVQVRGTVTV
jgi:hypothetical protein